MAVSYTLKKLVLTFLVLKFSSLSHAHLLKTCKIDHIYCIGDSQSDTGNFVQENTTLCAAPPYGESYFKKPTGRCSNGLLMIDFIALDVGIPFLPPYLDDGADFTHGANFAVIGATALPWYELAAENVTPLFTNNSLFVQLDWMAAHFNSICHNHKGFDTERACCGIGGKYNFNFTRICATEGVRACPNPDQYVSWDGIHATQQGYKIMTEWLLHDIFTNLHCHY